MKIVTNNKARNILNWWELTPKEQKEFNYLNDCEGNGSFFRYKGQVYDLCDFLRAGGVFDQWHGYASDSYFSGVLVRYSSDCDSVIVGSYFA